MATTFVAGTYCFGEFNKNFTLCPKGTYNPNPMASTCYRCPIGFFCPEEGLHVPRICPGGFVCEFTGIALTDNPCPEGHYCLEGTATSATTCGNPNPSSSLFPILSHAEMQSTIRAKRIAEGLELYLGSRRSGCWSNATNDFGLQVSQYPAQFWSEKHFLPLAMDSPFVATRGRFCLDDSCLRLSDENSYRAYDSVFDYSASSFTLRRPIPCPSGVYCHPGTSEMGIQVHNFSTAQQCTESMFCPEGSSSPVGKGECPKGFFCPFGVRISCPVGTFCAREGNWVRKIFSTNIALHNLHASFFKRNRLPVCREPLAARLEALSARIVTGATTVRGLEGVWIAILVDLIRIKLVFLFSRTSNMSCRVYLFQDGSCCPEPAVHCRFLLPKWDRNG